MQQNIKAQPDKIWIIFLTMRLTLLIHVQTINKLLPPSVLRTHILSLQIHLFGKSPVPVPPKTNFSTMFTLPVKSTGDSGEWNRIGIDLQNVEYSTQKEGQSKFFPMIGNNFVSKGPWPSVPPNYATDLRLGWNCLNDSLVLQNGGFIVCRQ